MKRLSIAMAAMMCICGSAASAHFQLLYTPEVNLEKAGDVTFKMLFWHPLENGHMMDMAMPEAVYYRHKGKRVDLLEQVKAITYYGPENHAAAFEVTTSIKRLGDYVFVVEPAPYLEPSEDIYIQQFTKSYVNRGGVPTDWMEPVGLTAEIIPMNKPTNVIAGSTFSGLVVAEGQPVAGAEIEIEYITAGLDVINNATKDPVVAPMPGGAIVAISDASGYFSFGIPKAGFWGFSALGVGPDKENNGKSLSQDAVIWIRAYDLK
jgi:cobalt/nickel transport protein